MVAFHVQPTELAQMKFRAVLKIRKSPLNEFGKRFAELIIRTAPTIIVLIDNLAMINDIIAAIEEPVLSCEHCPAKGGGCICCT